MPDVTDDGAFNAEQAVKNRLGDRHVDWWHVQRGNAHQPLDADVYTAYRDALIDAHTQLINHVNAITDKYKADHERSERWRQEDRAKRQQEITMELCRLTAAHGHALDAMRVVQAADRAGRKTVRVADVMAAFNPTKDMS